MLRRYSLARSFLFLFAAFALSIVPAAQGPEGTAVVRGRVVDGLSGRPLPHLAVQFSPRSPGPYAPGIDPQPPPRSVITAADGTFEVPRLVAFDYAVYAAATGEYLEISYGVAKAGGRSKLVTVRDGVELDIVIRAWRGATIAGHVFDERGRPLVGAEVRVFEKDNNGYGSAVSNDLGAYEIARLRPGQYAVGVPITLWSRTLNASPPARQGSYTPPFTPFVLDRAGRTILLQHGAPLPPSAEDGRARVHTAAFAGGATTKERAFYLPLGAGDVRDGIDIRLPAVRGTRVSGIVTSPTGIKGTILRLLPFDGPRTGETGRIEATAAADGSFVFVAVPPGRYVLMLHRREPPLTELTLTGGSPSMPMDDVIGRDPDDLWAEMPFTVGDADVEDLAITLLRGTPLTGRVVVDEAPPGAANAFQGRITLASGDERSVFEDRPLQVQRDGTISMRIRPGTYRILATMQNRTFKTAVVNGQEIGDGPLTIGADPLTDVRFVFGRYETTLGGSVADRRGGAAAGATVLVFPADRQQWFRLQESGRWRSARAANGTFQIAGLAPGDYYAIAVDDYQVSMFKAMAEELAPHATRVAIREGQPAAITLVVRDPE